MTYKRGGAAAAAAVRKRTQKVHHRIATKFDSEPQKKGRSKASLHSKAREKTKTSASRRSELDIDEILDSFQENVQGMYENFTSNLQSHVDANKRRLNRFQADSQKSIQKVSQQTIHALNVFGQLEDVQAKQKARTATKFKRKEQGLKKKLSKSSRANALVERLNKRLEEMEEEYSTDDEFITE